MSKTTILKAIKAQCLECVGHSTKEVELCPSVNCSLHIYRFGKDINTRKTSEKQRENSKAQIAKLNNLKHASLA